MNNVINEFDEEFDQAIVNIVKILTNSTKTESLQGKLSYVTQAINDLESIVAYYRDNID